MNISISNKYTIITKKTAFLILKIGINNKDDEKYYLQILLIKIIKFMANKNNLFN